MQRLYAATTGIVTPAERLRQDVIETKFSGDEDAYERMRLILNGGESEEESDVPLPPRLTTSNEQLRQNSAWAEQERIRRWNEQREAEMAAREAEEVPPAPRGWMLSPRD